MAFQPAPGIVGVEVNYLLDGQVIQNTLSFAFGGSEITLTVLNTLATSLAGWVVDEVLPLMPQALTFRDIFATDLSVEGGEQGSYIAPAGEIGANTNAPMTNNTTFTLTFKTGRAGKSNRGRNYVPALARNVVTNNAISSAFAGQLREAWAAMPTYLPPSTWTWVVLSRVENKLEREEAVGIPITAVAFADLTTDSQRRRLPGRGN